MTGLLNHDVYALQKKDAVEYAPEQIMGFTRHLISRREYYRAYMELKRIQSYYPGYIPTEKSAVTELYLLFHGQQYDEIIHRMPPSAGRDLRCIYTLFRLDACLFKNTLTAAKCPHRDACVTPSCGQPLYEMLQKRCLLFHMLSEKEDFKDIKSGRPDDAGRFIPEQKYRELMSYTEKLLEQKKSPALALALGLFPGMGYAYGGNRPTGVIALIVVTVMSALTAISVSNGDTSMAILFCTGAGMFYGGSIIGGWRETLRYNRETHRRVADSLIEKLELQADRDVIMDRYGIGNGAKH